jgi:hypothetical protein
MLFTDDVVMIDESEIRSETTVVETNLRIERF